VTAQRDEGTKQPGIFIVVVDLSVTSHGRSSTHHLPRLAVRKQTVH
jgi:hypothetical protein